MNCSKCSGRVWKAGDWSEEELYYCPGCSIHEDGKGQVVDPGSNGFWGGKEEASEMKKHPIRCPKCQRRCQDDGKHYFCYPCQSFYDRDGNWVWIDPSELPDESNKREVHAEVYYKGDVGNVHSDICPSSCDFSGIDEEYRKLLHASLDEWLDRSNGTGAFYIKGPGGIDGEEEG